MEIRELLLRGDGAVTFAGNVDDPFAIDICDRENVLGIEVRHERPVALGRGQVFVPARKITAIEERFPLDLGRNVGRFSGADDHEG